MGVPLGQPAQDLQLDTETSLADGVTRQEAEYDPLSSEGLRSAFYTCQPPPSAL
jgi:hypothetical protein